MWHEFAEIYALLFAACIFGFYAVIDLALLIAGGADLGMAGIVALSLATKLAGALLGAKLGMSKQPVSDQPR